MLKERDEGRRKNVVHGSAIRLSHTLLLLAIILIQMGAGDAYFLMGKLTWRRIDSITRNFQFRVDTVWARDNVGESLSMSDAWTVEIRNAWAIAVSQGPGALLPVPAAVLRLENEAMLPVGGGILYMNISLVDSQHVHAFALVEHTLNDSQSYNVSFEGCCRPSYSMNNAGRPFRLQASLSVAAGGLMSPVVEMHPVVQLRGSDEAMTQNLAIPAGVDNSFGSMLKFRLGSREEMGEGLDSGQPAFSSPPGISLALTGVLAIDISLSRCPSSSRCVRQVSVIVSVDGQAAALDFLVEVIRAEANRHAPVADYSVFLSMPESSALHPVEIQCGTGQVSVPSNSTYLVSDCVQLEETDRFPCNGYLGVCPPLSYAFVHPFDQPKYISCFSQQQCKPRMHRLYCTDAAAQSAAESSIRISFRELDEEQVLSHIVASHSLPAGAMLSPDCNAVSGICQGGSAGAGSAKFVDVAWRPDCATQLGLFIFCFVGVDNSSALGTFQSLQSLPTCVYVRSVVDTSQVQAWGLTAGGPPGGAVGLSSAQMLMSVAPQTQQPVRLIMYRQPSHSVAGEPMIVQPQVACVDENGNLNVMCQTSYVSASLSLLASPAELRGNMYADMKDGIATFTDLSVSAEGQGFALKLQAGGLDVWIETPRFTVLPAVRALRVAPGLPLSIGAGHPIGSFNSQTGAPLVVPSVYMLDADQHYVALSSKLVSVSAVGEAGGVLQGQTQVYAVSGVASFNNIFLTKAGSYRLVFACGDMNVSSTEVMTVVAGRAAFVAIDEQPCAIPCDGLVAGSRSQVAEDLFEVSVSVRDAFFNRVLDQSGFVSVALKRYPVGPIDSGLLIGCKNKSLVSGIASFTDCSVGLQGFYKLEFIVDLNQTNQTLRNTTLAFDVQVAVKTLQFITQPGPSLAGAPIQGLTSLLPSVELLDEYGYRTISRRKIRLDLNTSNIVSNCAAPCLDAALCIAAKNSSCISPARLMNGTEYEPVEGLAAFDTSVIIRASDSYRLIVISSDALVITSIPFQVSHAPAASIVVSQLPQWAILSEPFTLQPLVSLIDRFGNIVLSDSSGSVQCTLFQNSLFALRGFSKSKFVRGEARYENLAADLYFTDDQTEEWSLRLNFSAYTFSAVSAPFIVRRGVESLQVISHPVNGTAGQSVAGVLGAPQVRVLDWHGNAVILSARALSVRVNESQCADRFPPPRPADAVLLQAQLEGVLPVVIGQKFVLNKFVPVGFDAAGDIVTLKIVDGNFDCDSGVSVQGVLGTSSDSIADIRCFSDNCYTVDASSGASNSFIAFTINALPRSGFARVCARVGSSPVFRTLSLTLQQRATWKLHTSFQVLRPRFPSPNSMYIDMQRDNALDHLILWYGGKYVDTCAGFRTSSSDVRIAFVLSDEEQLPLNPDKTYECPPHPLTGQVYRWVSTLEALSLGTIFKGAGMAGELVYSGGVCGRGDEIFAGTRSAFLFSDSGRRNLYINAADDEQAGLHGGDDVPAGLVCILDEPSADCSSLCSPQGGCPSADFAYSPQLSYVPQHEDQELIMRFVMDPSPDSPELDGYLGSPNSGGTVSLRRGTYSIRLSLLREPASWVTVRVSQPQMPNFVQWDASTLFKFGGHDNSSWDFQSQRPQGGPYNQEQSLVITCIDDQAWDINTMLTLEFTLVSTVPTYNGQKYLINFRKFPADFHIVPSDRLNDPAVVRPIPQEPEIVVPQVDYGDFCVRGGAQWAVPGQPQNLNYVSGIMMYCGGRIQQVAAGAYHSCAVSQSQGYLFCWGRNDYDQTIVPADMQSGIRKVALGSYHTCAITNAGLAKCWGDNGQHQSDVPALGPWKDISAGAAHTCGVTSSGIMSCWGDSHYGQLSVPSGYRFESVSAGYFHTCGLVVGGVVVCWGGGQGTNQYNFGQTSPPSMSSNWSAVSSGNLHTCGISNNGSLACWGSNTFGQCSPPSLATNEYWTEISAGLLHTCGIASSQKIYCWGSAARNRLYVLPHQTSVLWRSVSAGSEHTCGLMSSGRISCWGFNTYSQLAVSTAPYVRFDVLNTSDPVPGLNGLRNQVGPASLHVSSVSATLFIPDPPPTRIFYSTDSGATFTQLPLPGTGLQALTFDVSVVLQAYAESQGNDPEIARGDISTKSMNVKVATPTLRLSTQGPVVMGTNVTISVQTLSSSVGSTQIRYTTNGSVPNIGSSLYSGSPVLLSALTGNASGISTIMARAFRTNAVSSDVAILTVPISAANVTFSRIGGTVLTNQSALTLSLSSSAGSIILYRVCAPSTCTNIASVSFSTYTGPFNVTESRTLVAAKATLAGVAPGPETVHRYILQVPPPTFFPNPNSITGYLAPLMVTLTCSPGTTIRWSVVGGMSGSSASGIASIELVRRESITAWCSRQYFNDSLVLLREYRVGSVAILTSTISESSNVALMPNQLTVTVSTTRPITVGSSIVLTGLTGSPTLDNPNLPISNPRLSASWSRASGSLTVNVRSEQSVDRALFAVTNASSCAERLPYGPSLLSESQNAAYVSTANSDIIHAKWLQNFYRNGGLVMSIEYSFQTVPRTLRQRMLSLSSTGERVNWVVTIASTGQTMQFSGLYRFSSSAGFTMTSPWSGSGFRFSADDGVWGALDQASGVAELNGHGSTVSEGSFWGHGVFDSSDASSCSTLYMGNNAPLRDPTLVSKVYLTELYADLSFSFVLMNPSAPQPAVSPVISLTGTFCSGCAVTEVPAQVVSGSVLSAQVQFALTAVMYQSAPSGLPLAENTINVDVQSNLPIPPTGLGTVTTLTISGLERSTTISSSTANIIRVGSMGKTETEATLTFTCSGYQSCVTSIQDYLPAEATMVSARLSVDISCSDLNSPDEFIQSVMLDDSALTGISQGPWPGCENACQEQRSVVNQLSLSTLSAAWSKATRGQSLQIRLQASPAVDSYSCSETSTQFVKAVVTLTVRYFFTCNWNQVTGTLSYRVQKANQERACEDRPWRDSGGYSCKDYAQYKWCSADGAMCGGISGSGVAWTCAQYAVSGISASDACCACGGGSRYLTRLSFAIKNPASVTSSAILARVTLNVAVNGSLIPGFSTSVEIPREQTGGVLVVCADGSTRCVSDPSLSSTGSGSGSTRRRLLAWAESSAVVALRLQWSGPYKEWLYSCCWDDLQFILAKAVADSVGGVDYRSSVSVVLTDKTASGVTANVTVMTGSDDDAAIVAASNLQDMQNLVQALKAQRVDVSIVRYGAVQAYAASGDRLTLQHVQLVGNNSIGAPYLANQASYPTETLAAYAQVWDIGRVLVNQTVAIASSGIVTFAQSVVQKACSSYRLMFVTDNGITALSASFIVKNAAPASLRVSPVPSMITEGPMPCSCSSGTICPDPCVCLPTATSCQDKNTLVVAGLYFSVTATLLDEFNNVVQDYAGPAASDIIRVENFNSSVAVFGAQLDEARTLNKGTVVLSLTLRQVSVNNRLVYTHAGTQLNHTSQPFSVVSGPIARLVLRAPGLGGSPLIAGQPVYPAPEVFLKDVFNNSIGYNLSVTASLVNAPGVLKGPQLNVGAKDGQASFQELMIQISGVYTLVASSDGFEVLSSPFTVLPAVVHPEKGDGSLQVMIQPGGAIAGEIFTVQAVVRLLDVFGNVATTFQGNAVAIAPFGAHVDSNTSLPFEDGVARFTHLMLSQARPDWTITFAVGKLINVTSHVFEVHPRLARIQVLQQPSLTAENACMDPPLRIMMLDEHDQPADFTRQEVTVAFSENSFRYTQFATCGTGGCTASKVFRFYVPEQAELVAAFLDVQVVKSDFDDLNEEVEFITVNGVPILRHCDPGEAAQCDNFHACITGGNVTELAYGNVVSVAVKISEAVNEHCNPRLTARIDLYGSYRPFVPERFSMTQTGAILPIGGTSQLVSSGRTLMFQRLIFPEQGVGYRLILTTPSGVSVETDRFNVLAVASLISVADGQQPSQAIAGEAFGVQPMIRFLDARGKLVTTMTSSASVAIFKAQNSLPSSSVCDAQGCWTDALDVILQGNAVVVASGGQVRFSDLRVNKKVDRLVLQFSAVCTGGVCATLDPITSSPFRVFPPAANLTVVWDAQTSIPAGLPISVPPSVWLVDAQGQRATLSMLDVASSARNTLTGVISSPAGDAVVKAVAGTARFSNVIMPRIGTYTLLFSFYPDRPGFIKLPSAPFVVVAGPPARLFPLAIPSSVPGPYVSSPFPLSVELRDEYNNLASQDSTTTVVARASVDLFAVNDDFVVPSVSAQFQAGVAVLMLRVEVIAVVNVSLSSTLLPYGNCSAATTQGQCAGNVRQARQSCITCIVTASTLVTVETNPNLGTLKLSMVQEPSGASDGQLLRVQPTLQLQQCLRGCVPVEGTVRVSLGLVQGFTSAISLGGRLEARADTSGRAAFSGLYINGSALSVTLLFSVNNVTNISSAAFLVGQKDNSPPELVAPSPGLCDDSGILSGEPVRFYVLPGSSFMLEFKATDANAMPADNITIEIETSQETPGYFTENLYDQNNLISEVLAYTCRGGRSGFTTQLVQQPNIVSRLFVWSPVEWFPPFVFQYFATENDKTPITQTCKVSVAVEVCQRPSFTNTRDPPVFGLASAPVVIQVSAVDLNQGDIVSVEMSGPARGQVIVGDEVYREVHHVDGLSHVLKNQVSRSVTLVMPSPAQRSVEVCFRARDNAYACDVDGLLSEDQLCIVCALEASQVTAMCTFEVRSDAFNTREHVPVCGDGRMTGMEQCDDRNHVSGDGCSSTCTVETGFQVLVGSPAPRPICGDGLVVMGEGCDDRNTNSSDGCSLCQAQVGYECGKCWDQNDRVYSDCSPKCGDGIVIFPETCDDGNARDYDGCSALCKTEVGYKCPRPAESCIPDCGDGDIKAGEQCDDGNVDWGDGCSQICTVEEGFRCRNLVLVRPELRCFPIYGDGKRAVVSAAGRSRNKTEDCDDGNTGAGDGCFQGLIESGFFCCPTGTFPDSCGCPRGTYPQTCSQPSQVFITVNGSRVEWTTDDGPLGTDVCRELCGDRLVINQTQGACDDGNWVSGDGCANCQVEVGWTCPPGGSINGPCTPLCGDGIKKGAEECDDGNRNDFDGCSSLCKLETGFTCSDVGGCTAVCGNGQRMFPEECDDNNTASGDGCSSTCKVEKGWYCVGSSMGEVDVCSGLCGDGVRIAAAGEECDDGAWSRAWGDGCTDSCVQEPGFNCRTDSEGRLLGGRCEPICGDARWVLDELCDDGNTISGDGCSSDCKNEPGWTCGSISGGTPPYVTNRSVCNSVCNDGIVVGPEQCDDGNSDASDGCSPACTIEPGFSCFGEQGQAQVCRANCGDGVVVGKEFCDDGNMVSGDGCTANCLVEEGWECIPANCSGVLAKERCKIIGDGKAIDDMVLGVGSVCEACPPVRLTEARCSNPPCPPAGLTSNCQGWRLYDDGGWVRVADKGDSSATTCNEAWSGDGFCDPANNNADCAWDGGDCCSSTCDCGSRCYNSGQGGCGSFEGSKGEFHCLDPAAAAAALDVRITGTTEITQGKTAYLSVATVTLSSSTPGALIYYSLDGTLPAYEAVGQRVTDGTLYSGPFQVLKSVTLTVSSIKAGARVTTNSTLLNLKVAQPTITPPSNTLGQRLSSPIRVSLATSTPGASIWYSLQSGGPLLAYTAPFQVLSNGNVTAVARKDGLLNSQVALARYTLFVDTPTITPNGSALLFDSSSITLQSNTVSAQILWTLCAAADWTKLTNKSKGETVMSEADRCFPECKGICRGGTNEGAACLDAQDIFETCSSRAGTCSVEYALVRLCDPTAWPRGARVYTRPLTLNASNFGSNAILTAVAIQEGLARSNVATATFRIQASAPVVNVYSSGALVGPIAPRQGDFGPLRPPVILNFSHPVAGARILYTLDGTQPSSLNTRSTRVFQAGNSSRILVNVTTTVTAIAVAGLLEPSAVTTKVLDVQLAAPVVTVAPWDAPADALLPPFMYPAIGARGDLSVFWSDQLGSLYINVTAQVLSDMPASTAVLYSTFLGASGWSLNAATWYDNSAAGRTVAELLASGWKRYTAGTLIPMVENTTIKTVAVLAGARTSAVAYTPVYVRTPCPKGHKSEGGDGLWPCTPCPLDQYKEDPCSFEWNCVCNACPTIPVITGTSGVASQGAASCQLLCPPGTSSLTGLHNGEGCTPCPKGTYMKSSRAAACSRCPAGTTTMQVGSTDMFQCVGSPFLSAGGFHSCGVDQGGQGACWGYNAFGQTELPTGPLQQAFTWHSISAGSFHSCGVTATGQGLCWGQSYAGKTTPPAQVTIWLSMYASKGYHHSCGISTLNKGYCWGDSQYNQSFVPGLCTASAFQERPCRRGTMECGPIPAQCQEQTWMSLSPGQFHTCGVLLSGKGLCWGDNSYGQSSLPTSVAKWRVVSAGHYHTCGVTSDGEGLCWGSNVYGATDVPEDVDVWSSIAVGRFHSCGITASGGARCWGSNQDGATAVPLSPTNSSWVSLSVGLFHSCAVDERGAGTCWGRDVYNILRLPVVTWRTA